MKVSEIKYQFTAAFACSFAQTSTRKLQARLIVLLLQPLLAVPAFAQGAERVFQNLNSVTQIGIAFLVAVGVLAGLGLILGGLFSMYKKYDRGSDDVTWGKIGMQISAGGLAMALSYVGVLVVETMGGSQSDIGRTL